MFYNDAARHFVFKWNSITTLPKMHNSIYNYFYDNVYSDGNLLDSMGISGDDEVLDERVQKQYHEATVEFVGVKEDYKQIAEEIYTTPGINKKTLELNIPAEVKEIKIENSREIVIIAETEKGTKVLTFESPVPISAQVSQEEFRKGKMIMERRTIGNNIIVVISSSGMKNCSWNETLCSDGKDNDCDAKIDAFDDDCCPDVDNDGFTNESCGGNDCNDYEDNHHGD